MGVSPYYPEDVAQERMRAWAVEWNSVAACTDRADRPRAEAALRELYRADGRAEPRILWVSSPAAGLLAHAIASRSYRPVRSAFARGDVGNGNNLEFNSLAEPFAMEPAWRNRLIAAVHERLPPERRSSSPGEGLAGAASGLGINTSRLEGILRLVPRPSAPAMDPTQADGPATDVLAGALGPTWTSVVQTVGTDLARELFLQALRAQVADLFAQPQRIRDAVQAMQPGQWDAETPVLAAAKAVFGGFLWRHKEGRAERERSVALRLELARSAGQWWALDGLAIISERPLRIRRDDRGRQHSSTGPAVAWADGNEMYAWHGVGVEARVIASPGTITVEEIDRTSNVEVRRVLIEQFGEDRLIREGGARLIGEDATGRLWRREFASGGWSQGRDEPIVMVEVLNSTPEPDGTRKTYFLRVPPTMKSARQAVAWTFGLGSVEYRPAVQT